MPRRRALGAPVGPSLRRRMEEAVETLIAALDALDAPGDELEPEPVDCDGFADFEPDDEGDELDAGELEDAA